MRGVVHPVEYGSIIAFLPRSCADDGKKILQMDRMPVIVSLGASSTKYLYLDQKVPTSAVRVVIIQARTVLC